MKATSFLLIGGLILAAVPPVSADVLTLSPVQAVVLPPDGSGLAKAVLMYNLAGLSDRQEISLDEALIEWNAAAVPSRSGPTTRPGS